jgi:hypothetical protein
MEVKESSCRWFRDVRRFPFRGGWERGAMGCTQHLGNRWQLARRFSVSLEAASGFEPLYKGFADPRLNHLATPPLGAEGEI